MKGYTKLIQKIQDHTQSCIERFCTRQAKEIEILCTLNGGLKPHRDPKGRLHASKDGYQDTVGKVYRKGQYIPMDFENENAFYSQPKYKVPLYRKIKLIDEMIEDVKIAFSDFEVEDPDNESVSYKIDGIVFSFGSTWENKFQDEYGNGKINAYIYIKAASVGYLNIFMESIQSMVASKKDLNIQELKRQKELEQSLKGDAPNGKQTIKAKIIGLPIRENYYGIQHKVMLELENKSTAYGSLPAKIFEAEIGDIVEFTATFESCGDDKTHAFFKRPSKALIVETNCVTE